MKKRGRHAVCVSNGSVQHWDAAVIQEGNKSFENGGKHIKNGTDLFIYFILWEHHPRVSNICCKMSVD